jgi:eukaryotic-like serine/threonine-protein kinase
MQNQKYTQLHNLLAAGKWKEADEETRRVMLVVANREKEDWLREKDIDNFPCEDLHTINHLWVKYSNGRFGFSVQKRIYQSLGGAKEYNPLTWVAFNAQVGWGKSFANIYYKRKAPEGHLPFLCIAMCGRLREGRLLSRQDL